MSNCFGLHFEFPQRPRGRGKGGDNQTLPRQMIGAAEEGSPGHEKPGQTDMALSLKNPSNIFALVQLEGVGGGMRQGEWELSIEKTF